MRRARTQWHTAAGDIQQEAEEKKTKKKRCRDENAHVGLIHLTSPSASCLAADLSQFVFRGLKRKCWSVILERRTPSLLPVCCLDSLHNKLLWAGPCKRQGHGKGRPGQAWINDISGWLRDTLPYQAQSNSLDRAKAHNLSRKSFAFPSYPISIFPPLLVCLSPADVSAVKLDVFSYKLTSV